MSDSDRIKLPPLSSPLERNVSNPVGFIAQEGPLWFTFHRGDDYVRFCFEQTLHSMIVEVSDGLSAEGAAKVFLEAVKTLAKQQGFEVRWPGHPG